MMAGKERIRLSDAVVTRLRPREREYTVWDTRFAALGVRVRPSGGATYVLLRKTEGKSRRVSLGPITSKSVDDVRRECHAIMAKPSNDNPAGITHGVLRFRDFVLGPWKDACFPRYKPSTRKYLNCALSSQLLPAFGSTRVDRITRSHVLRWFDAYSQQAPGGANRVLAVLRQVLDFAVACNHISINPVHGVKLNRRDPLVRFLSRAELRRLHQTLNDHCRKRPHVRPQADIIRLLLLTGCRRGEILSLRWCEVGEDTLALSDTKTGPRTVHLNVEARRILKRQPHGESAFVFPSPRDSSRPRSPEFRLWNRVRRDIGIEDVRLHDLRHTHASHAVMHGVPLPVVSRLLGHGSAGMTMRYAHLADKDTEDAAERIGVAMARIMALE